jgi:hypothetical protein
MADQAKTKTNRKDSEKQLRKAIQEKLAAALADHKNGIDEKDFQSSLKKVSKILSKDISEAVAKKQKKEKKAKKKSGKKKKKEFLM